LNLLSTAGVYVVAAAGLVWLADLVLNFRPSGTDEKTDNPWNAGTLEWLPSTTYQTRSIPIVTSREPLWDQPGLAEDVRQGRYFLPGSATGRRETIITAPVDPSPQYILLLPGPSWLPLLAALGTAGFFLLLTIKLVFPALVCGVFAVAMIIAWLWSLDLGPAWPPQDIGAGIKLPVYATGPISHSWWGTVILLLVDGALFVSMLFSYLYLWIVNPEGWPPDGVQLPPLNLPAVAALALVASGVAIAYASGSLRPERWRGPWPMRSGLVLATLLMLASFGIAFYDVWQTGLRPTEHAYGAVVYTILGYQGLHVVLLLVMACYVLARSFCGRLEPARRASFDNTMLIWSYTVGQGLVALATIHLFPRLLD
jgi:cytochrome c oxidase subunit I+III